MTDNFTGQWEVEIKIEELEKYANDNFRFDGREVKRSVSREVLKDWLGGMWTQYKFNDLKSKLIIMDATFLYAVSKLNMSKFKIFYKDLYPGDTEISYVIWVVFE